MNCENFLVGFATLAMACYLAFLGYSTVNWLNATFTIVWLHYTFLAVVCSTFLIVICNLIGWKINQTLSRLGKNIKDKSVLGY